MTYYTMEKRLQPPAVKIERTIFDLAEKERKKKLKEGDPLAVSSISWFTNLVKKGLESE